MGTRHDRSWENLADMLRTAAADFAPPLGRAGSSSPGDDAAAARLKDDVSRLERTASDLISTISTPVSERGDLQNRVSAFDRERAQRSAEQLKTSLEDLAALAVNTASDVGSAPISTLKRAEPELKHVASALETVAESATLWIRTMIDPEKKQPGPRASEERPPLDDL